MRSAPKFVHIRIEKGLYQMSDPETAHLIQTGK